MKLLLLFFTLILTSCNANMMKEVVIKFPLPHSWEDEYKKDMWYTLEYFNGDEVIRKTIIAGVKEVKVDVYYDSTIIAAAYPLDKLAPLGGALENGKNEMTLNFSEGYFASALIKSVPFNKDQIKYINYDNALGKLPENYDIDDVYFSLLEGKFSKTTFKDWGKQEVILSQMPSGKYIPELDGDPIFINHKTEDVTLNLSLGIHRYAHFGGNLYYQIIINKDEVMVQTSQMPYW